MCVVAFRLFFPPTVQCIPVLQFDVVDVFWSAFFAFGMVVALDRHTTRAHSSSWSCVYVCVSIEIDVCHGIRILGMIVL